MWDIVSFGGYLLGDWPIAWISSQTSRGRVIRPAHPPRDGTRRRDVLNYCNLGIVASVALICVNTPT